MEDHSGEQIDRYRLLRVLGSGGFGTVYLAEQIHDQTHVALKLLPPLGQEGLRSFLTEARMMRLHHPHIVPILDFGQEKKHSFLVMAYAPHGTLRQRHPTGTHVPLPLVLSYVQQLASALQYAHDEQVIHRDVKPENMLLDAQDQVLLSDFGIASILAHSLQVDTQLIIGTLPYMAPEQTKGHPSRASDQYTLALVVYEWLCGERPFRGTGMEVAIQHRLDPPPALRHSVPDLSPAVEQVVLTALAKEPEQRFASIQAFADALQAAATKTIVFPPEHEQTTTVPLRSPSDHPLLPPTSFPLEAWPQGSPTDGLVPFQPVMPESSPYSLPIELPVSHLKQARETVWTTPKKERQGPKFVARKPSIASHQRVKKPSGQLLHKREGILVLVFFVLLAIGSSGFWAFQQVRNNTDALTQQAPVAVHPTATATIEQVYNRAVAKEGVQFGFDAQHDRFNPYERQISASNVSHLRLAWTSSANNGILSSPAIANAIVYMGSMDGALYAIPASGCNDITCAPLWTASTSGSIYSSPAIANGIVYISSYDNKLYAFQASGCGHPTCAPLWTASIGTSFTSNSSPAIANGVVYVGSGDRKLYAFQASGCGHPTCAPLWTALTRAAIYSSPAIANGVIYIGSEDNNLYAFQASGCGHSTCVPLWTSPANDSIFSSPAIANGNVYVGSRDQELYVFHLSTFE